MAAVTFIVVGERLNARTRATVTAMDITIHASSALATGARYHPWSSSSRLSFDAMEVLRNG